MQTLEYDPDGNLDTGWIAGDMNCDGTVDSNDTTAFWLAVNDPATYQTTYPNCNILNGDINGDGLVDDADGDYYTELLTTGNTALWVLHTWNSENRLIAVEPGDTSPNEGVTKVAFKYDYRGRRIEKKVWLYQDSAWVLTGHTKFIYDGWLLLLELNGLSGDAVLKKYTWGQDLSRTLQGAGAIGGLLATHVVSGAKDYLYYYDNLGNVGQMTDHSATFVAKYEYNAYGGVQTKSGSYAGKNPFRFSTKYFDDETGLGYWGYRYYSPSLGRWLNRDPLGEEASIILYVAFRNNPAMWFDADGRQDRPASQPATQGGQRGCCGPEVGDHVQNALDRVKPWFDLLSNQGKSDVCTGIWDSKHGWDISDLAVTGGGDDLPGPRIEQAGCGTGKCRGTVQVEGKCYLAGEVNYILFGRISRICADTYWRWTTLRGRDPNSGRHMRWDDNGRRIYGDWWSPETMIATILGYRLGQAFGLIPVVPSAPAGSGGTGCRVAWALSGYGSGKGPAGPDQWCEERRCGKGCCEPYTGSPFRVRVGGRDRWVP